MKSPTTSPLSLQTVSLETLLETCSMQMVRCPNCGSPAARYYQTPRIQTQCSACDYYMVTCAHTGSVVEAYAPGISVRTGGGLQMR